jgi:hypothetical protein
LRQVGELAWSAGARVLVDELYLETLYSSLGSTPWRSAFHLGNQFIATSSLTKAYGFERPALRLDPGGTWARPCHLAYQ